MPKNAKRKINDEAEVRLVTQQNCPFENSITDVRVSGWPRLFHSMGASRQTELQREFSLDLVCSLSQWFPKYLHSHLEG